MKNKVVVNYLSSFQSRIQIYVEKFTKEKLLFFGTNMVIATLASITNVCSEYSKHMKIHFIWSDENYAWTIRKKNVFQSSRDNPMMTKQRVIILTRVLRKLCGISVANYFHFQFFKKAKIYAWAELKMTFLIFVSFQTSNFHEEINVGNTGGILILTLKICDHLSRSAWLLSTVGALCNRL